VLLKPRFERQTLLLWLLTPLALAGGGLVLLMHGRRRTKSPLGEDQSEARLSAEEQVRLQRLMAAEPPPENPA
jgi:cytochrome c-type biogenesis protein CcmH